MTIKDIADLASGGGLILVIIWLFFQRVWPWITTFLDRRAMFEQTRESKRDEQNEHWVQTVQSSVEASKAQTITFEEMVRQLRLDQQISSTRHTELITHLRELKRDNALIERHRE